MFCSTFKLLLAGQILHRVDEASENLTRKMMIRRSDLLVYAPVTSHHVDDRGMSVADLIEAAVELSDNTAANLLLKTQGGPEGLNKYLQSIGDFSTHLDRTEPLVNTPVDGKDLDSTTPKSMAETIQKLIFSKSLKPPSRELLIKWLLGNKTGKPRLKAGLPPTWKIADKTGTGDNGATHDVGILFPPDGQPIVIAAFISDSKKTRAELEMVLSKIGMNVSSEFAHSDRHSHSR